MNKEKIALIVIIILSAWLRLYRLADIPASLNQDEIVQGYDAYSILKTGRDEHGEKFPLLLTSFGDEKMALQAYAMIPFIYFIGLNEISVRLPSAISGIISTFFIYLISRKIFKNKKIALFGSFLYALSAWNIYFSRAAYEINLGITIFLVGLYFFLSSLDKRNTFFFFLSSFFFSLTFFIYHSHLVFTSLFFLGLLFINRKKIIKIKSFYLSLGMFVLFFVSAFFLAYFKGGHKVNNLLIFSNKDVIYRRVEVFRAGHLNNNLLTKIIHNKYLGESYEFFENYLSTFSPKFLFDSGGQKVQHNLGYFGNFHLFDAILIIAGLIYMIVKKEKFLWLIIIWFGVAPIPASLTMEPQNSTRLYVILPVMIIICGYGLYHLLVFVKNKFPQLKLFLPSLIMSVYLLNALFFLDGYFVHLNDLRIRFWNYGFKEMALIAKKYPSYKIISANPTNFSYVYFLFYNQYDPLKFQKEVFFYPTNKEGFMFVKKFGRFEFPDNIDYTKAKTRSIYFQSFQNPKAKTTIKLPTGEPFIEYLIND